MNRINNRDRYENSLGRSAISANGDARRIKQAKWVAKNMPESLTEEDKELLASLKK